MKPRRYRLAALAILMTAPPAAAAALDAPALEALRGIDLRLATIAYRLTTTNAPLCRDRQPATGLVVHAIDQYDADSRAAARAVFGFAAPVGVEAVVAGSPAATAGIVANDALVAVDDHPFATEPAPVATSATRDAAIDLLAAQPTAAPLRLSILRGDQPRTIPVPALVACRAAFEILLGPKMTAESDGRIVQIGVRFFERYTDAEVAVVVAHELAHIVLRHRARLEAAGVEWGMMAEIGRNGRLFRRTENEADLLGLHLLRNAGYDPQSAPTFWRTHGRDIDNGLFRSRSHPSSKARADTLAAAIAALPADAPLPYVPPVLATLDAPLE